MTPLLLLFVLPMLVGSALIASVDELSKAARGQILVCIVMISFGGTLAWKIAQSEHMPVQVLDVDGHPLAGAQVGYSSGDGFFLIIKGSIVTDRDGRAVVSRVKNSPLQLTAQTADSIALLAQVNAFPDVQGEYGIHYSWKQQFHGYSMSLFQQCYGLTREGEPILVLRDAHSLHALPYVKWLGTSFNNSSGPISSMQCLESLPVLNRLEKDQKLTIGQMDAIIRPLIWLQGAADQGGDTLAAALNEWASSIPPLAPGPGLSAQAAIDQERDLFLARLKPLLLQGDTTAWNAARQMQTADPQISEHLSAPLFAWIPDLLRSDASFDHAMNFQQRIYPTADMVRPLLYGSDELGFDVALLAIAESGGHHYRELMPLLKEFVAATNDDVRRKEGALILVGLGNADATLREIAFKSEPREMHFIFPPDQLRPFIYYDDIYDNNGDKFRISLIFIQYGPPRYREGYRRLLQEFISNPTDAERRNEAKSILQSPNGL